MSILSRCLQLEKLSTNVKKRPRISENKSTADEYNAEKLREMKLKNELLELQIYEKKLDIFKKEQEQGIAPQHSRYGLPGIQFQMINEDEQADQQDTGVVRLLVCMTRCSRSFTVL